MKVHMCYLIIIEQGDHNLSAYVPDLPGCVATGQTRDEALSHIREAIEVPLQGMREDGETIPRADSDPAWVDVSLPSPVS